MILQLKNLTGQTKQLHLHEFQPEEVLLIDKSWYVEAVISSILNYEFQLYLDGEALQGLAQIEALKGNQPLSIKEMPEPLPFAQPTFKTCNDASVAPVTCPKGATTNIDYVVTAPNLYVSGGQIHVKNNEFGDYSKAQVIDLYGYLPQEMRAAFPAYPVLNEYVKKRFIPKDGSCMIDTKPLNAHVPQGMVLRSIFTATNEGEDRIAFVNYDMQLKL